MTPALVTGLHRSPSRRAPMEAADAVTVVAERGIAGDHHQRHRSSRQVVLMEAEVLDDLGLEPGQTREQVCVRGLQPIAAGDVLIIGEARLEIVKPRVPCQVMDGVRPGLRAELEGRAGWCARAVAGGDIRVGDAVVRGRVDDPEWLHDYRSALAGYEGSPDSGPGLERRLAILSAWNEDAVRAIATGRFPDESPDATPTTPVVDLETASEAYRLHDSSSTGFVEAARGAADRTIAESWGRFLSDRYRAGIPLGHGTGIPFGHGAGINA